VVIESYKYLPSGRTHRNSFSLVSLALFVSPNRPSRFDHITAKFANVYARPFGCKCHHFTLRDLFSIQTDTDNPHSRSSVVSVLFSLISETFLRELLRLSTFWIYRGPLSLLMPPVSVASIALPLADANLPFSSVVSALCRCLEKRFERVSHTAKASPPCKGNVLLSQ
jgi:hypothetical protein